MTKQQILPFAKVEKTLQPASIDSDITRVLEKEDGRPSHRRVLVKGASSVPNRATSIVIREQSKKTDKEEEV